MQWQCEECGQICETSQEFLPRCPLCGGATHSYSRTDRVKAEIRSHVKAIDDIVRTALYPDELYQEFLKQLNSALESHGAAIWHIPEQKNAILSASIGVSDALGREAWEEHRDFVVATINTSSSGQEIVLPSENRNPTTFVLLIQKKVHARCPLVVEVAQRPPTNPAAHRGYSVFVKQMAEKLSKAKCIPWNY
jgi:predicted  nucleic acid-binding Zn-ribbon protein